MTLICSDLFWLESNLRRNRFVELSSDLDAPILDRPRSKKFWTLEFFHWYQNALGVITLRNLWGFVSKILEPSLLQYILLCMALSRLAWLFLAVIDGVFFLCSNALQTLLLKTTSHLLNTVAFVEKYVFECPKNIEWS